MLPNKEQVLQPVIHGSHFMAISTKDYTEAVYTIHDVIDGKLTPPVGFYVEHLKTESNE